MEQIVILFSRNKGDGAGSRARGEAKWVNGDGEQASGGVGNGVAGNRLRGRSKIAGGVGPTGKAGNGRGLQYSLGVVSQASA